MTHPSLLDTAEGGIVRRYKMSILEKIASIVASIPVALGVVTSILVQNPSPVPTITPTPTPIPIEKMQFKNEVKKWPYSIKYIIWIPENGGTAEGDIRGYGWGVSEDCGAHFIGNYEGGEGGKIEGSIEGECEIPLFGGKITGKLEGQVYPSKRGMQSWINGKIGSIEFNEYLYSPML